MDDNLDIAHFYLQSQETERFPVSNYVSTLEDTIFEGRTQSKILSFKAKAPQPQRLQDTYNNIYSAEPKRDSPHKKRYRHIAQAAEKILDAPELADDYYLNILDWGRNNILAVALGSSIYLWNATTSNIAQLPFDDSEPVTSLSWDEAGNYLAVGTNRNTVTIWDVEKQQRLREMRGHSGRVGVLAWADHILSSGSRDSHIFHHDVRVQDHHISTLYGHSAEVCGLKWNFGHTLLASGGNDNIVNIWDIRNPRQRTNALTPPPLFVLPHTGAVKALAWCPFQHHLLATGGGTSDRMIRFWSSSTGSCLNSIDTKSQVCQLLWSTNYREIVSSHGYSQNQLTIWRYPSMNKVAELEGHTSRVLYMALSPDGETCVSGAGDETLRFWKIFEKDHHSHRHHLSKASLPSFSPSAIHGRNTMIR